MKKIIMLMALALAAALCTGCGGRSETAACRALLSSRVVAEALDGRPTPDEKLVRIQTANAAELGGTVTVHRTDSGTDAALPDSGTLTVVTFGESGAARTACVQFFCENGTVLGFRIVNRGTPQEFPVFRSNPTAGEE